MSLWAGPCRLWLEPRDYGRPADGIRQRRTVHVVEGFYKRLGDDPLWATLIHDVAVFHGDHMVCVAGGASDVVHDHGDGLARGGKLANQFEHFDLMADVKRGSWLVQK